MAKHGQKSIFQKKSRFSKFGNFLPSKIPAILAFCEKIPKKVSKISQKLEECALCLKFGKKRPKIFFAKFDHFYLLKCGKKSRNVSRK